MLCLDLPALQIQNFPFYPTLWIQDLWDTNKLALHALVNALCFALTGKALNILRLKDHALPDGGRSAVVGRVFSLADNETKNAKGTNHKHTVK